MFECLRKQKKVFWFDFGNYHLELFKKKKKKTDQHLKNITKIMNSPYQSGGSSLYMQSAACEAFA